jgi:hypothetical protein
VERFPVVVTMDAHGGSLHREVLLPARRSWQEMVNDTLTDFLVGPGRASAGPWAYAVGTGVSAAGLQPIEQSAVPQLIQIFWALVIMAVLTLGGLA